MFSLIDTISQAVTGSIVRASITDGTNSVLCDVSKSFTRNFTNQISEHAIENGADISDNAKTMPTEMAYSVLLSDTNYLGILAGLPGLNALNSQSIKQRFNQLQAWLNNKTFPLTLITDEEHILNLIIKDIHENRSPGDGNGKLLEISFRQISVVSSLAAAQGVNYQGYQPMIQQNINAQQNTSLLNAIGG